MISRLRRQNGLSKLTLLIIFIDIFYFLGVVTYFVITLFIKEEKPLWVSELTTLLSFVSPLLVISSFVLFILSFVSPNKENFIERFLDKDLKAIDMYNFDKREFNVYSADMFRTIKSMAYSSKKKRYKIKRRSVTRPVNGFLRWIAYPKNISYQQFKFGAIDYLHTNTYHGVASTDNYLNYMKVKVLNLSHREIRDQMILSFNFARIIKRKNRKSFRKNKLIPMSTYLLLSWNYNQEECIERAKWHYFNQTNPLSVIMLNAIANTPKELSDFTGLPFDWLQEITS